MEQLSKLYQEYNDTLRLEEKLLNCKPTELRHLIGRIGEFVCAMNNGGELAKVTNQHGFDYLYVVQYIDDEFKTIYYGPKEAILPIKIGSEGKFEVDISKLLFLNIGLGYKK